MISRIVSLVVVVLLACCGKDGVLIERGNPGGDDAGAQAEDAGLGTAGAGGIGGAPSVGGTAGGTAAKGGSGGCDPRAYSVAAANLAMCARRVDGKVLCWGDNEGNTIGLPVFRPLSKPIVLPDLEGVLKLDGGGLLFCASFIDASKRPRCWGTMKFADGSSKAIGREDVLPTALEGEGISLGAGICMRKGGKLTCWGGPWRQPQVLATDVAEALWDSDKSVLAVSTKGASWTRYAEAGSQPVAGLSPGIIFTASRAPGWGYTTADGALALTDTAGSLPVVVPSLGMNNLFFAFTTTEKGGCAQKKNGKIACWTSLGSPVQEVQGATGGEQIVLGWDKCVLQSDWRILCWQGSDWNSGFDDAINIPPIRPLEAPTVVNLCP